MCSVGDDFESDGNHLMKNNGSETSYNKKCNKCPQTTPVVLLRHKDAYCRDCFLAATTHKFKALLGKSRLIHPNDNVLVSYEVGHPSTALMHLLRSGLDLQTPKKLRFEPIYVFLEDQFHLSVKERREMVGKVADEAERFGFQMHLVSLASSISTNKIEITGKGELPVDAAHEEMIKAASITNRKEIINIKRQSTLVSIAKQLNCKFIFTPELSVHIATNLLTNICLGKGSQVPDDTGFCDKRDDNVRTLRPLRNFDMKELAFYNWFHKLEPVSVRQYKNIENQYSSVQSLMKQFITNLDGNYPATVATVVKTGDKLALDSSNKVSGKCKLCQGIVLKETDELDSENATNFSKILSNYIFDDNLDTQERYLKVKEKFFKSSKRTDNYCFSCSKISDFLLVID